MLALSDYAAAFAAPLLAAATVALLATWGRREGGVARAAAFALAAFLGWRYMAWRFTETIPPIGLTLDALAGWGFALFEAGTILASSVAFLIMSRSRDRRPEADRHAGWWRPGPAPRVDLLIPTYNEEEAILERTIAGAMVLDHPRLRVWVLDDGRRPWLAALCERLGANYLTRADNRHAKAGNINAALSVLRGLEEPPDFVAVLDADFVPHRDFLTRSLALFHDASVGLVQTPQHFFNADPIQHNLGIGRAYPDEQRFFFDHVQPARDAWGIAFCCGTSSVVRWTALEAIGGIPTDSVTEDLLVTLRLRKAGWGTAYLAEPLTEGLAPEGLGEYVTQRARWCLGAMQIMRGPLGPFARNGLRWQERLGLLDTLLYWVTTYPFRLACVLVPLPYWYLGVTVVDAPVPQVISYFLPYILATLLVLNWTTRGLVVPVLNDVAQLLGAREITRAVVQGLTRPEGQPFKVTAKGGDRSRTVVQWTTIRPLLIAFALNAFGPLFSLATDVHFARDAGDGTWVILAWTIYNLVVLGAAMAVCVERPRVSHETRHEPLSVRLRLSGGHDLHGAVTALDAETAELAAPDCPPAGTLVELELPGLGWVAAEVARSDERGACLALRLTPAGRALLLAGLHTRPGAPGPMRSHPLAMLTGLVRRTVLT
jgi:cellulose synthase (UDP-forming)